MSKVKIAMHRRLLDLALGLDSPKLNMLDRADQCRQCLCNWCSASYCGPCEHMKDHEELCGTHHVTACEDYKRSKKPIWVKDD